jgi:GNAT superfamily N-acetyltransferase
MCDEWMPLIRLPLTKEQLRQLPRNGAYRYELIRGEVYLTPHPKHYHALLDLKEAAARAEVRPTEAAPVTLREVRPDDWADLAPVFAAAFRETQPFGSLDGATRRRAAEACLQRTRSGGDGPWIAPASFVAEEEGVAVGGLLVTLLPAGDPCAYDSYYWPVPPPPDCIERRLGRPHLTWVFVSPDQAGRGAGTTLLNAAVARLVGMGFEELVSTFLLGNESSTLWHWRNGFRLLEYPGSHRRRQRLASGS